MKEEKPTITSREILEEWEREAANKKEERLQQELIVMIKTDFKKYANLVSLYWRDSK